MSAIYKNGNWYGKSESQTIQVDTLPTASADELGKVYQYVGPDTANYKSNFFYKCTLDTGTGNYSWVNVEVQPEGTVSRTLTKAEYDNLTEEEKNDGTVYYVNDWSPQPNTYAFINRINLSDVHDGNEHVIGSWMGKPLYQKTVDCGALTNNSVKTINHNISDIDNIVGMRGITIESGLYYSPLSVVHDTSVSNQIALSSSKTTVTIANRGRDCRNFIAYVTFQYTKTTDSAGTTVYASENEYSTDETIVGKWIDGKPLYQKTFTGLNVSLSSANWTNVVSISGLNIDVLIDNMGILSSQNHCFRGSAKVNNGYIQMISAASAINILTIRYTKTS